MADVFFAALAKAGRFSVPGVAGGSEWALLTLHRQENTANPENLRGIFAALWNRRLDGAARRGVQGGFRLVLHQ